MKADDLYSSIFLFKFVYVLEGELKVVLKDYSDTLYANESLHIDSTKKHTWFNETDQPAVLLVVSSNEKII